MHPTGLNAGGEPMNVDDIRKKMNTTPDRGDTQRTLGWKMLLESAQFASQKGDVAAAAKLYDRAIELVEKRLGPTDMILAHIMMQYAHMYEAAHETEKAQKLYTRARDILSECAQQITLPSSL